MQKIRLEFLEVNPAESREYSEGCSGSRSDCCTRVCTRNSVDSDDSLQAWDKYLEEVSGVIQY